MSKTSFHSVLTVFLVLLITSCSTTKLLQEGEYRLASNSVVIENDSKFSTNEVSPYIKQKSNSYFIFGWNPFLNLYNTQNGKDGGWDKFVKKIGVAPVVFDSTQVSSSIDNIYRHLEYLGYYNSSVQSSISTKRKLARVKYIISLGKQYPIGSISYVLPQGIFAEEFLQDTTNTLVKIGSNLSESLLEAESVRSSKVLRDKGFYEFSKNNYFYEADTLGGRDSVALQLTINEYTRNESGNETTPLRKFYINDVSISYPKNLKLREKALTNLNIINPGELYSETAINNTYSRFSSMKLFNGININTEKVDTNQVDCSISLSQSKIQGFKVNLEASINSSGLFGVSPQVSYFHKNIFRGGEWLNISFKGNFQFMFSDDITSNELGVSAGLSFPKFLGLPISLFNGANIPRTEVNASFNYQSRPEYTRNIISVSYGYNGNLKNAFFYQVYPVQVGIVRILDITSSLYESLSNNPFMLNAYQDHFDIGLGSTLYYTTNPDVNPKNTYSYARLEFDISGNLISLFKPLMSKDENGAGMIWGTPYSQYVRAELTLGKTWRFGRNNGQAFATRALAGFGYAYGNSTDLPFEKHFYAGGSNSLRGWMARTVGPGLSELNETWVISNQTGDCRLEINGEYRFQMFWKIAGAAFIDAGNVWTLRDEGDADKPSILRASTFLPSIAASWGAGIRLDLDFLVIRVDLGLKVHDPDRTQKWLTPSQWFESDGYALHFGVGYPF